MFRNATLAWVVAAVLALTVVGLSFALATTGSGPARAVAPVGGAAPRPGGSTFGGSGTGSGSEGSSGGSGPFAGSLGVVGTVSGVSVSHFTVTDRSGQAVTVDEESSTTYYSGRTSASSSIVTSGARVLVRGTRQASTVTASSVIVLPAGGFGAGSSASG